MPIEITQETECPNCRESSNYDFNFEGDTTASPELVFCNCCSKPFVILWTCTTSGEARAIDGIAPKKRKR